MRLVVLLSCGWIGLWMSSVSEGSHDPFFNEGPPNKKHFEFLQSTTLPKSLFEEVEKHSLIPAYLKLTFRGTKARAPKVTNSKKSGGLDLDKYRKLTAGGIRLSDFINNQKRDKKGPLSKALVHQELVRLGAEYDRLVGKIYAALSTHSGSKFHSKESRVLIPALLGHLMKRWLLHRGTTPGKYRFESFTSEFHENLIGPLEVEIKRDEDAMKSMVAEFDMAVAHLIEAGAKAAEKGGQGKLDGELEYVMQAVFLNHVGTFYEGEEVTSVTKMKKLRELNNELKKYLEDPNSIILDLPAKSLIRDLIRSGEIDTILGPNSELRIQFNNFDRIHEEMEIRSEE